MKKSFVVTGLLITGMFLASPAVFAADEDNQAASFCQQQADQGNFESAADKAAYIAECEEATAGKSAAVSGDKE